MIAACANINLKQMVNEAMPKAIAVEQFDNFLERLAPFRAAKYDVLRKLKELQAISPTDGQVAAPTSAVVAAPAAVHRN